MNDEKISAASVAVALRQLTEVVEEISAIPEYRNAYKKQFCNLARRIKLLAPMFEELCEATDPLPAPAARSLAPFVAALDSARDLLRFGSDGSKISLVLDRDMVMKRFQEVTAQLEEALNGMSFDNLEISDEIKEQVELVHSQFKRAKERLDMPDTELYNDLSTVYNRSSDASIDPALLKRLAEKLQLMTISDLTQESLALHELVVSTGGDPGENIEKMSMLLKKIKDFVQTQNPEMGTPAHLKFLSVDEKPQAPVIPDDFRCPISLELMKDPVIVSTGQTYERACIEKWLEGGHDTCPKTKQKLLNATLTTNYVLRSLIAQWCEANGMDPPKRTSRPSKPPLACSSGEHTKIVDLISKLSSPNLESQRSAAGELRLLAKRSADNRLCIAEAGAIPLLVSLLSTSDPRTQEHAVTALLNLSICEENKGVIIAANAVPGVVHVLRNGSMETRENAAATLFSLSVVDENKVTIGASGAIPALATLLREGSQRGKKDAATALFNLCIYQGNKGKAVRAGVVPTLMGLLTEQGGNMVDESLAILGILAGHPEGKAAIGSAKAVPVLVEVIRNGSPRNRENATAVLVHLCGGEQQLLHMAAAQECGVMSLLQELAQNGTDRGKRKATQLLDRMNRFLEQQRQAQAQAEALALAQAKQSWVASMAVSSDS